ncbi:fungal-specific transcription factor domain-containing protein [Fusarium redolens]|uniref:Fungal-specific transcription factor domain-containing protein n=1 Tax=Fusarium redolens TaxID=48865 RepID=A0A9P9FVJ6_FUSRE|nr:fungal-specific transcription factor domain-containing protein [Fusarium redolens]KAH7203131.1 fungal-specific transcription factor domain-containing protein [Fusarium redolens]
MRFPTACSRCRRRRKKCFQTKPGGPCDACAKKRHHQCSLVETSPQQRRISPHHRRVEHNDLNPQFFLSHDLIEDLVENYIHYILDRPHTLFHLPTLRAAVKEDRLGDALLFAILAFGCRFHSKPEIASLGPTFMQKSKQLLKQDMENICLENIQTCVLLANLSSSSKNPESEALFVTLGIRMAEILGLHHPDPADSEVLRETKCRVWWTLFMADRWSSIGRNLRRAMPDFDQETPLPMDEDVFHHMDVDEGSERRPTRPRTLGLWAYNVMLAKQLEPIQNLNKQWDQEDLSEDYVMQRVADLADGLRLWEAGLPKEKKATEENLRAHSAKGLGGPFLAIHTGYHQHFVLLFFRFLDLNRTQTPKSIEYAELCKHHASAISHLVQLSRQVPNCELVFGGVGYMTVVSSAVLLHTLIFGQQDDTADIRAKLESNFEAIFELQRYWPSIQNSIRRLQLFQKTCTGPGAMQTYKFDKWMVRFLVEHHLPLDEPEGNLSSGEAKHNIM